MILDTINWNEVRDERSESIAQLVRHVTNTLCLHAAKHPQQICVMLIDPVLRDVRNDEQIKMMLEGFEFDQINLIKLLHPQIDESAYPIAITLDLNQSRHVDLLAISASFAIEDWRVESFTNGKGHRIGGWLFTANADHCIKQLAQCLLRTRINGKKALLRLHDPSVLDQAWEILTPLQRASMLPGVNSWWQFDRFFKLREYKTDQTITRNDGESFDLNLSQWHQLEQIEVVNLLWMQSSQQKKDKPVDKDVMVLWCNTLLRAQYWGLTDKHDCAAFAWHAFIVHPLFDSHPTIESILKKRSPEIFYSDAIADIDEQAWEAIRSDLLAKRER
jgi:hypothetical protein